MLLFTGITFTIKLTNLGVGVWLLFNCGLALYSLLQFIILFCFGLTDICLVWWFDLLLRAGWFSFDGMC